MRRRCARKRTRRGLNASTSNAERKVLPVPVAETSRARVSPLRWITPSASRARCCILLGLISSRSFMVGLTVAWNVGFDLGFDGRADRYAA